MNNKMNIRRDFLCQWTQQWLPKIIAIIKENTSELNKKRMKPLLDVEKDLNDNNGKTYNKVHLHTFCFNLHSCKFNHQSTLRFKLHAQRS